MDTSGSEALRARVIASYDIAGARAGGELDDIVDFAAELCGVPIAMISLVEDEYQRFLARRGFAAESTPRGLSFCAHAMYAPDVMEVPDATLDPRFVDNALVTGAEHVRFYAGAPLVSSEGVPLGALCVIDTEGRDGLTPMQRRGLTVLARGAMSRLDDRRTAREQGIAERESRQALEESDLRFRILADTMPQMVWSTRPDGFHDYYNARWYDYTGVPDGSTDGEGWNGMFHPDDQDAAWTAWRHSLTTGAPYSIEYRLRHRDGTYRWVLGRALPVRGADGAIQRWFGTCTDIHSQKLALEEREIISQELSHRIKNIFAVIAGLVGFSARNRPEFAPIASDLRERIAALGRAPDFVRPHSDRSRPSADHDSLKGLLNTLFEAYQQADDRRITVTGDDIRIDDRSATPLALLFHELATNATKYGALSAHDGAVSIAIDTHEAVHTLVWRERGGPIVSAPQKADGFGSQLIELSAVRQLGGRVTRDWCPDGLTVSIAIPAAALHRG